MCFWGKHAVRLSHVRLWKKKSARFTRMNQAQNTVHSVWTGAYTVKESRSRTGEKEGGRNYLSRYAEGVSLSWIVGITRWTRCRRSLLTWPEYFSFIKAILIATTNSARNYTTIIETIRATRCFRQRGAIDTDCATWSTRIRFYGISPIQLVHLQLLISSFLKASVAKTSEVVKPSSVNIQAISNDKKTRVKVAVKGNERQLVN